LELQFFFIYRLDSIRCSYFQEEIGFPKNYRAFQRFRFVISFIPITIMLRISICLFKIRSRFHSFKRTIMTPTKFLTWTKWKIYLSFWIVGHSFTDYSFHNEYKSFKILVCLFDIYKCRSKKNFPFFQKQKKWLKKKWPTRWMVPLW